MFEGNVLKFVRKEIGLTQVELASNICTVRYLRKIEKNEVNPSYDMMAKFAEKLGLDIYALFTSTEIKLGEVYVKYILKAEQHYYSRKFLALEDVVTVLLNINNISSESNVYNRLLYYKAICLKENHNDYKASLNLLLQCLNLRSTDLLRKKLEGFCMDIELEISNAIAVNIYLLGNKIRSRAIFEAIDDNILNRMIDIDSIRHKCLYNLTKICFELSDYDSSIYYANQCLTSSRRHMENRFMAECFLYLAKSYKKLGRSKSSEINYKRFVYLKYMFGDSNDYQSQINYILANTGITFDKTLLSEEL